MSIKGLRTGASEQGLKNPSFSTSLKPTCFYKTLSRVTHLQVPTIAFKVLQHEEEDILF